MYFFFFHSKYEINELAGLTQHLLAATFSASHLIYKDSRMFSTKKKLSTSLDKIYLVTLEKTFFENIVQSFCGNFEKVFVG